MSQLKAVIFGAIGTVAETSNFQRQAFNLAFADAGLDWSWNTQTYRDLLKINGGQNRIKAHRDADPARFGVSDEAIAALHAAKTRHYVSTLRNISLCPRTGVVELVAACKQRQIKLAFCTSTATANVAGISAALADSLPFDQFSTIITSEQIDRPKPAADAYIYGLDCSDSCSSCLSVRCQKGCRS